MRALTLLLTMGLLVSFTAGCGEMDKKADEAKKKAEEAKKKADEAKKDLAAKGDDAKKELEKKAEEGKTAFLKPIMDQFPEIGKKIEALAGDKKVSATTAFDALKKLVEDFKTSGPDKWEGLKDALTKKFEEVKKMVGL